MKKILLAAIVLMSTALFAQTKGSIVKGYAFVQVIMPGTIMVDDNGRQVRPPLNISRVIYIEVKGKTKPIIENVQYKNEILKVAVSSVSQGEEHIGVKKNAGAPLTLVAAKGNTLWRLDLQATDGKKMMKDPVPYKNIIIKEYKNRKYFNFTIGKETELESPMSV